jgi:hypothetical protein
MKRIILLFVVLLMAFGGANAFACRVCIFVGGGWTCPPRPEGAIYCDLSGGDCIEIGVCPALAARASLATQYTIASVERLDQRILSPANAVKTARLANNR